MTFKMIFILWDDELVDTNDRKMRSMNGSNDLHVIKIEQELVLIPMNMELDKSSLWMKLNVIYCLISNKSHWCNLFYFYVYMVV